MKKKSIWRGIALAVSAVSMFALFTACGDDNPSVNGGDGNGGEPSAKFKDGWYVLTEKTVQKIDVTNEFTYNCIYLKDGAANWYEIDYTGKSESTGAYTVTDNSVSIEIGVKTYKFAFDGENETISYAGKINRRNVVMKYKYDEDFVLPVASTGVSFTEELFGPDKNESDFYNYCPSVMMEGNDTLHVWYCSNRNDGNVTDYVAYRKGTLNASGKWDFSELEFVLGPGDQSSDDWDWRHACDPSVTKGTFTLDGENYSYLMAYLGCRTSDNSRNEVGIAVAKAPQGPWVKVNSLNPIANFYESEDYAVKAWGYGQPCVINPEGNGKVYLFYTKGLSGRTSSQVEEWDFSDLNQPRKLRSAELGEKNVTNASSAKDCIRNADFAYDSVNNRLYFYKDDFPLPTNGGVTAVSNSSVLMYLDLGESGFDLLFGGTSYSWNKCANLTANGVGYARLHNVCIVTDPYGNVTNPFRIPVFYTASELATAYTGRKWAGALHTYRLHGYVFEVK